jgi:hypothetical protein
MLGSSETCDVASLRDALSLGGSIPGIFDHPANLFDPTRGREIRVNRPIGPVTLARLPQKKQLAARPTCPHRM